MKAGFTSPWANAPSTQRREPTSDEITNGFPCGPADQKLFNELMYRESQMMKEIENVITGSGATPSDADLTQLRTAIRKEIELSAGTATFYIHAASGNDANSGSAGAPLQTLHEAFNRGRRYRALSCILLTDITLTTALPMLTGTMLAIFGGTPGYQRAITFTSTAWTTDPFNFSYSLRMTTVADFYFEEISIVNNITNTTPLALIHCSGGQMVLKNCSYSVVSASARPLIRVGNFFAISFQVVTYDSTAAGKILVGVAAGANPNIWPYSSNLTAL